MSPHWAIGITITQTSTAAAIHATRQLYASITTFRTTGTRLIKMPMLVAMIPRASPRLRSNQCVTAKGARQRQGTLTEEAYGEEPDCQGNESVDSCHSNQCDAKSDGDHHHGPSHADAVDAVTDERKHECCSRACR